MSDFEYLAPHLNATPYRLSMGVKAGNLIFLCGQAPSTSTVKSSPSATPKHRPAKCWSGSSPC